MRACCADADCVIAADAGYLTARRFGREPDLLLGDYDSAPAPAGAQRLPAEKDDTDTHFAAKKAVELGARRVTILGGTGGRLDHTLANFATLLYLARSGVEAVLADASTEVRALLPGTYRFARRDGWYLSLFPLEGNASGITLRGVKYPLCGAELRADFPLGTSNEILAPFAEIICTAGALLCVFSKKEEH